METDESKHMEVSYVCLSVRARVSLLVIISIYCFHLRIYIKGAISASPLFLFTSEDATNKIALK